MPTTKHRTSFRQLSPADSSDSEATIMTTELPTLEEILRHPDHQLSDGMSSDTNVASPQLRRRPLLRINTPTPEKEPEPLFRPDTPPPAPARPSPSSAKRARASSTTSDSPQKKSRNGIVLQDPYDLEYITRNIGRMDAALTRALFPPIAPTLQTAANKYTSPKTPIRVAGPPAIVQYAAETEGLCENLQNDIGSRMFQKSIGSKGYDEDQPDAFKFRRKQLTPKTLKPAIRSPPQANANSSARQLPRQVRFSSPSEEETPSGGTPARSINSVDGDDAGTNGPPSGQAAQMTSEYLEDIAHMFNEVAKAKKKFSAERLDQVSKQMAWVDEHSQMFSTSQLQVRPPQTSLAQIEADLIPDGDVHKQQNSLNIVIFAESALLYDSHLTLVPYSL